MTKQPVLVLGSLMPYLLAELEKRYAVEKLYAEKDALKFLQDNAGRFRAAVTSTFTGITADMIDLLPQVEIISSFGVGTDSLDVAYANTRGIRVANTPDVLNEDTANMALLLLLAATRDLVKNDRFVREGRWARGESAPLALGIEGKRVGLVGLGRIGSVIAKKLLAFGCDVAYHTRSRKADAPLCLLRQSRRARPRQRRAHRHPAGRRGNTGRDFPRGPAGARSRRNIRQCGARHGGRRGGAGGTAAIGRTRPRRT